MIHFNELYVTEDGSTLVIDAEIDDFGIYDNMYISSIKVTTGKDYAEACNFNKAVEVYTSEYHVGDVNMDGVVDSLDIALLSDIVHGIVSKDSLTLDQIKLLEVNDDGELNVGDVDALINAVRNGTSTSIVTIEKRHVRLCLDIKTKLSDIVSASSKNNHLFFVQVEAAGTPDAVVGELQCGWDSSTIIGAAYNGYPLYGRLLDYLKDYGKDCGSNTQELLDFILRYYGFIFALRAGDFEQAQCYWEDFLTNTGASASALKSCGCHGVY